MYGLLAGMLAFWVTSSRPVFQQRASKERLTIPITLEEETSRVTLAPVVQPPGATGVSEALKSTGSIDPSLLQREEVLLIAPRALEVLEVPDPLNQPAKVAVDVHLPVAVGGTGLAHGAGQGHGRVAGRGSGRAMIRGVPGMNPELDLSELEVIHEEIPQYPLLAEWGRIQGDVVVRVTINERECPSKRSFRRARQPSGPKPCAR